MRSPLDPEPAGEVLIGLDDPRLDLHLWRPLVEVMDDPLDPGRTVRDVPDDERVGPGIDLDLASWAEIAFRDVDGLRRVAVIEVDDARHELLGFQRRFFRLGGVIPEPGDVGQGVDPQDVPFADLPQVVQLEYEVERLVPRHVQQFQRHLRLDRFPDDHVETADVGDQSEHAADLCVLEVQGNTLPGESLGAAETANIGRLIRFRLRQRRYGIEELEPFRHWHRHAAPWAHARDVRCGRGPITRCIRRSNGYPRPSRTHLGRARSGTNYRLRSLRSLHCLGLFRPGPPEPRPRTARPEIRAPTLTRQPEEAPALSPALRHCAWAQSQRRSVPSSAGSGRRPAGFLAAQLPPRGTPGWSVEFSFGHLSGTEEDFDLLRAFSSCDI